MIRIGSEEKWYHDDGPSLMGVKYIKKKLNSPWKASLNTIWLTFKKQTRSRLTVELLLLFIILTEIGL